MGNGSRKAADGSHALLGDDFLLEPFHLRKVLKIDDEAGGAAVAGPQRRNRQPQIALFARCGRHFDLAALRERSFRIFLRTPPDFRNQIAEEFPPDLLESWKGDLKHQAIEEGQVAIEVSR